MSHISGGDRKVLIARFAPFLRPNLHTFLHALANHQTTSLGRTQTPWRPTQKKDQYPKRFIRPTSKRYVSFCRSNVGKGPPWSQGLSLDLDHTHIFGTHEVRETPPQRPELKRRRTPTTKEVRLHHRDRPLLVRNPFGKPKEYYLRRMWVHLEEPPLASPAVRRR